MDVDRISSLARRQALGDYLTASVDDGHNLLCSSAHLCRASIGGDQLIEGQLGHVGESYEVRDHGRPLRILVVGMQVGGSAQNRGGFSHITLDERTRQIGTAKPLRATPAPRTPHMVGTELALKVLLGLPVESKGEVNLDSGGRCHVFDMMSLVNVTLCSRTTGSAKGQGSPVMIDRCARHLAQTIDILRPTVILAQGWRQAGRSPSRAVAEVLGIPFPLGHPTVTRAGYHGSLITFIAATHPTYHWTSAAMPGWKDLESKLVDARRAALSN